jgi:nicotinamide-nucleotide amidase
VRGIKLTVDVEIIGIGNELLIGKVENTNAFWLARQITALGGSLTRITVIKDIIDEIACCINEVSARKPHFIITTGGLGPTFDDKTFQGIAKALNQKLVVNPDAYDMVKRKCTEYAQRLGVQAEIEMTPPRVKMAVFPENTAPIKNPLGSAPALRVQIGSGILFALKAIFNQTIAPAIKVMVGPDVFCECSVFSDEIVESNLAPLIDRVMTEHTGVYIKSHPLGFNRVELHFTIIAENNEGVKLIQTAAEQLRSLIIANGGTVQEEPMVN